MTRSRTPARKPKKSATLTPFLGEVITSLRLRRNLTIEQLADRSDLHWTTISVIEAGKKTPGLGTIEAIAEGLEITPSELLREAEKAARA